MKLHRLKLRTPKEKKVLVPVRHIHRPPGHVIEPKLEIMNRPMGAGTYTRLRTRP